MRHFIAIAALVLLTACTTPKSPQQDVWFAESTYANGLRLELAYSKLPRCTTPSTVKLCSTVSTIRAIKKIDDTAWDALQAAELLARNPPDDTSKLAAVMATAKALTNVFFSAASTLKVR